MPASVAPLVAGWQAANSGRFAVPDGGSTGGQPFLPNVLPNGRIWVEMAFGADLTGSPDAYPWQDVTADVMFATKVAITQGRADETSQAQPATCAFTLLNTTGRYTPYNPNAALYPNVRRGTPVRVRVGIYAAAYVIFQGSLVGCTPAWNTSASKATASVSCAGTLRRLSQGKTPLRSPLYRSLVAGSVLATPPSAYWPMEDGSNATSCASAIAGVGPLVASGSVTFGADGPAGSAPLPNFAGGGFLRGSIPNSSIGQWIIHATIKPSTETGETSILSWRTTGGLFTLLSQNSGGGDLRIIFISNDLSVTGFQQLNLPPTWFAGGWQDFVVQGLDNGTGGTLMFIWANDFETSANFTGTGTGLLPIRQVTVNQMTGTGAGGGGAFGNTPTASDFGVGHLAVWNLASGPFAQNLADSLLLAFQGYAGESPTVRLARICGEENVPIGIAGTSNVTMGAQPIAALTDVLTECAATDGGVLYDGFSAGLGYISRSQRYNLPAALTVDTNADQLGIPYAPVDDDQRTRNDVTASSSDGTSARFIGTTGPLGTAAVGTYDTSVAINVNTADQLSQRASWEVHLGTVEGLRIPGLALDFTASPELIQPWLDAAPVSFRTDVLNVVDRATQAPPDDMSLVVEGYSTQLDTLRWSVAANCSPASPYAVGTLDDAVLGHLDTAGCVLAGSGWDGVAGTFQVTTTSGPLWTTSGGDYPFDLNLSGQRVTVSGCAGGANPQTFTVSVASVNGVTRVHPPGESLSLWEPLTLAL